MSTPRPIRLHNYRLGVDIRQNSITWSHHTREGIFAGSIFIFMFMCYRINSQQYCSLDNIHILLDGNINNLYKLPKCTDLYIATQYPMLVHGWVTSPLWFWALQLWMVMSQSCYFRSCRLGYWCGKLKMSCCDIQCKISIFAFEVASPLTVL